MPYFPTATVHALMLKLHETEMYVTDLWPPILGREPDS